jgi:hypothetical protein
VKISIVLALLLVCLVSGGDAAGSEGAASYLSEGLGARWLGMGGAARAAARDAYAGYWNPACLTAQGPAVWQAASMLTLSVLGRSTGSLAGSYLSDRMGAFGAAWIHREVGGLERVDGNGNVDGRESDAEDAILLSWASRIAYQARAGITVKVVHQDLLGFEANGASADFGFLLQPLLGRELFVALVAANAASAFAWETGARDELGREYALGLSYSAFRDRVLATWDAVYRRAPEGLGIHAGLEAWVIPEAAVRLGYDDGNPAGGATYFWKPYELDYAFTWDRQGLGDRHQISLLFSF